MRKSKIKKWLFDDREQLDKFASNFVQLCITMAGFSGAFVILTLTPDIKSVISNKLEWSLLCFLVSGFGYTVSATLFGNCALRPLDLAKRMASTATNIFLVANIATISGFVLLVYGAGYSKASTVMGILLGITVFFFFISFILPRLIRFINWLFRLTQGGQCFDHDEPRWKVDE